jgi:predicted DNA-binding transcriptional regulator YafY
MSHGITKLQRWLDLVAYLANRRFPVAVEDLRENIPAYSLDPDATEKEKESSRRKFERDKDELRDLGIPIETVDYSIGSSGEQQKGYRLTRKNFHLPYLKLVNEASGGTRAGSSPSHFEIRESEVEAALGGLREIASLPGFPLASHARSAFRKLAFDLEPTVLRDSPVLFAPDAEAESTADALVILSQAVRERKTVTFHYHAMTRDAQADRSVRPFGLLFQHGHWYVVGHDERRSAIRMFRVGRMRDVQRNEAAAGTPDFTVPDDFRLEAYGGRKAWELGEDEEGPVRTTVLFRFPRALWAERNRHGELVEDMPDGSQLRAFEVRRRDPFLRWVLSLAGDATVRSPTSLRDEFRALAARVAQQHREATDG